MAGPRRVLPTLALQPYDDSESSQGPLSSAQTSHSNIGGMFSDSNPSEATLYPSVADDDESFGALVGLIDSVTGGEGESSGMTSLRSPHHCQRVAQTVVVVWLQILLALSRV